jgi:glutathione S-transferase
MIELYEWPPTRSQRVKWVLEELEVEYFSRLIKLLEGEQNSSEYRQIQPLGVVPAIKTDNYSMFESVAIVMQLIDEHPEKKLAPAVATAERASYYQWCVFACAEIDPPVMMFFDNTLRPLEAMRPPGEAHDPKLAARARSEFKLRAEMVSNAVADKEYLVGNTFSGADILVGHSCFMASHIGLPINDYPDLQVYYERLQNRPAFQRAYPS